MVGQRFKSLLVIARAPNTKWGGLRWQCLCDCGNKKIIRATHLRSGATTSCGCYRKQFRQTHNMTKDPLYGIWLGMMDRCYNANNPQSHRYGGRGISVCERWQNFLYFHADMHPRPSPGHSIDRINNDEGYSPENCRWATREQQSQSTCSAHKIKHNGITQSLSAWSRAVGVGQECLLNRLRKGLSGDDLLCPVKEKSQLLTIAGKTQTVVAWAKEVGLRPSIITYRLRAGWSDSDAVNLPKNTNQGFQRKR